MNNCKSFLCAATVAWVLLLGAMVLAGGCATTESMDYAGTADYQVRPVMNEAGELVGYEARIRNGKEIGRVKAGFRKIADGSIELILDEEGVTAFQGQAISADAAARMTEAITRAGVEITPEITRAIVEALTPSP